MGPFENHHYEEYPRDGIEARRRLQASGEQAQGNNPLLRNLSKRKVFVAYILVAVILFGIIAFWGYLRVNSCSLISNEKVSINGSTAFAPLVRDVAHDYEQKCLGANMSINTGSLPQGSVNGLQQVENGNIDIGTSDVFANPYQDPGLKDFQVAVVVFALVVNNDVNVTNLTTNQIQRIYSGDVTNWNDVGGKKNQQVVLISRPTTSGTRLNFEKYVLGGIETISGPQSLLTDTSDAVAMNVKEQPGAIGYISLYYANKYKLKVLSIDGMSPRNSTLVKKDLYHFWSIEHMYTKNTPDGPTKDFIEHMFSTDAQRIIDRDGCLNPQDFPERVLINHILAE